MSSSFSGQTDIPPSHFKPILDAAWSHASSEYKKNTGKELLDDPLATEVQQCDSVHAILAIFQGQAEAFQQFRDGDRRLMKWISPVVDVLHMFSKSLDGVAGTTIPCAKVVFTGISVLLAAAKDVRASHDVLVELFERIESFFKRLGVYTRISLTTEMEEVFVKIVAEVLSILSIATKEVRRTGAMIYCRKLLGRTDIEDAFKRLHNLTQDEIRMAMAQTMKAAIEHKDDAKKANAVITKSIDEIVNNTDEIKWNQIEQDVRRWFSPPEPSTNHNTACDFYHNEPPTWFFEAGAFVDWMSNGSLLWIHGKPGSGKSIVCSAIIEHIKKVRDAGEASLAYFYFDFRDEGKQNVRSFVTSLLVQFSAYSKPCCDITYRLYLAYGKGAQQPSTSILMSNLKEMLTIAGQHPTFIIMDALDECPDSGMPTPREAVLNLVKDLVQLHLPNLHICASSRPEVNIQTKLKPLAVNTISLHDETRQKTVIANYVNSVVSSDEYMGKWREEDKKLVVKELSEKADGMFQWVFCQLETLRHAVQPDVRGILKALPRTLDETYERMLKNIHEKNREHARRLLHCLAVAVRPLRVEELAEILAFDFEGIQGRIPKFHAEKRPEDQEKAVLSTCPSLITIVYNRDSSPVVQFSHLSVKEYLTSNHFVSSSSDLSMYHILPEPSHTLLAQVCLGLLLDSDGREHKNGKGSPLAKYAARHWVTHAQFEDVASRVMGAMKSLFDPDKPHFATWIDLFDIDAESGWRLPSEKPSPMYYAALCGFPDLVQHLAIKHPRHVDSIGGSYGFPLFAALCRNHFGVVEILLKRGGSVDVRDKREQTALHKTILDRNGEVAVDAIRFLLEHGADVNARRDDLCTPLHLAVNTGDLSMTRMLLDHQADINSRNDDGQTPLHLAVLSRRETSQDEEDGCDLATLLLERGANSNEQDKNNATPLHLACYYKKLKIVRVLLNHHAKANTKTNTGDTALHGVSCIKYESQEDGARVAQLLLECGMDVNARGKDHSTPLHVASYNGKHAIAQLLLSRGAKADTENDRGETPLHSVAMGRHEFQEDGVRIAQQLLEHGVDMNAQCKNHSTPLHIAVYNGKFAIVRLLLDHGANANAKTDDGVTPLHLVSWSRYESQRGVRVVLLLLECGADVNAQRKDLWTPLHVASYHGKHAIARLLLDCGAISNAEDSFGETPLHSVSGGKYDSQEDGVRIVQLLLECGVDVNARRKQDHWTPLHIALLNGQLAIARLLLDHGAKVDAVDSCGKTALHHVSEGRYGPNRDQAGVARLLLEYGANVDTRDSSDQTPLYVALKHGKKANLELTQLLLENGGTSFRWLDPTSWASSGK